MTLDDIPAEEAILETSDGRREKSMTIGAVTKALKQEFPDISISKIRYLEDQKLLAPRRTPGGYRLYSQTDVGRLRTILRLQRDEFLPLRVIRQGGNRVGESFPLESDRMTVGRRPDADVFLDDVTVSRDHAVLVRRSGAWFLDDSGSLNGTYVNRRRIESHKLDDGDELQVGKYKLTYLAR